MSWLMVNFFTTHRLIALYLILRHHIIDLRVMKKI